MNCAANINMNDLLSAVESANIYHKALEQIIKSPSKDVEKLKQIAKDAILHADDNRELNSEVIENIGFNL